MRLTKEMEDEILASKNHSQFVLKAFEYLFMELYALRDELAILKDPSDGDQGGRSETY